jgi:chromosome segregation ATPase
LTTESLGELITRRDQLKINTSTDQQRHELAQVIGAITELLHQPFRIEGKRLTQKRSEIAAEHEAAQHQRAALRNDLVHAQAARTATLAYGDDPAEHVASADELSAELESVERRIGELQHRLQGVDGQLTELTVAEGAQMVSGVSAS